MKGQNRKLWIYLYDLLIGIDTGKSAYWLQLSRFIDTKLKNLNLATTSCLRGFPPIFSWKRRKEKTTFSLWKSGTYNSSFSWEWEMEKEVKRNIGKAARLSISIFLNPKKTSGHIPLFVFVLLLLEVKASSAGKTFYSLFCQYLILMPVEPLRHISGWKFPYEQHD